MVTLFVGVHIRIEMLPIKHSTPEGALIRKMTLVGGGELY